jgi:LytS/YehU family sensor histidine kinase
MVIGVGMRLYNYFVVNPMLNIPNPVLNFWDLRPVVSQIFSYMAVICMAITIKLITNKVQLEQFNEELQEEKKKAELNFLKTQMQPHFLFNTLNTLYSETIQDSGKGQLVVLHLSSMLRFILEECNKPFIRFEDEIKVIKDFIALEQLRHGDRLKVNIKVKGVTGYAMISPLVFLPFIENSFKHSLTIVRGSIQIDIEMGIESGYCFLMVENECISSNETKRADTMEHGKGIINIKRQLDLIYGKDYSLSFNGVKDKFHVSLKVPARSDFKYVEN